MARAAELESATFGLTIQYSNQLNYARMILREGDLNPHIRVYETRELPLLYPAIYKGNNLLQGTSEGQVTSLILSFRARWYLGCDPLFPLVDKYYKTNQELLSKNIFREY